MFRDPLPPDEASVVANLAVVLIAGRVVLFPLAPWIRAAATIEGARAVIRSSAAGLVAERVMLGPSRFFDQMVHDRRPVTARGVFGKTVAKRGPLRW
jgi:hypothetical protein